MNKNRGFTLLELLIVIAIIGILVSVGTVSFSSAQKKGRDSRRVGDLKAIQAAWEQYYADSVTVSYPATCSIDAAYLPAGIPVDPRSGTSYADSATCGVSQYCFCAELESGVGNSAANCSYGAGSFYCVSNLQ